MHATVVAHDAHFGGVLCVLIESVSGCTTSWQANWQIPETDLPPLVLGYVEHVNEIKFAEEYLLRIDDTQPRPSVILIGEIFDAETKIKLLKLGAVDCLERPVNLQRLRYLVDAISVRVSAMEERREVFGEPKPRRHSDGTSKFDVTIRRLSQVDTNLLLTGETGVGKSYIARRIHENSDRRKHPFVTINCAAIPESLFESELFGHKKGSFTGADANKMGKFLYARNGTVLLDELDAMPLVAQAKLLHAVEDREFQPIGSNELMKFSARIIAASNSNLEELVDLGRFRADLFFRLDVYEFSIPTLKNRIEELDYFIEIFVHEYAKRHNGLRLVFSDEVLEIFHRYSWPGNLRELRNCIEHAAINCEANKVTELDLPPRIQNYQDEKLKGGSNVLGRAATIPFSGQKSGHDIAKSNRGQSELSADIELSKVKEEIETLLRVLAENNYNRTRAAKEMGISRTAFYKKLHRYHLA